MPAESRAAFSARGSVVGGAANCVFCAIVEGETSATEVYRDDDFVAFLDAHPVFPGHVLMVPRRHVQTYDELPEDLAGPWLRASQALERAVESAMDADGSLLIVNNVVSQSVPHLHVHVVPRTKGDGLRGFFWPRTKYVSEQEAREYAGRVAAALAPPRD